MTFDSRIGPPRAAPAMRRPPVTDWVTAYPAHKRRTFLPKFDGVYYAAMLSPVLVTAGSTYASIFLGGQGAAYYIFVLCGFALGLPLFVKDKALLKSAQPVLLGILTLLLGIMILQSSLLRLSDNYFDQAAILRTFSLVVAIGAATQFAALEPRYFRIACILVVFIHLPLLGYGVTSWQQLAADADEASRLGGDVHTAVWAELALGTFLTALLSGKRWLMLVSGAAGAALIAATQMRGVGLAAAFAVVTYTYFRWVRRMPLPGWLALGSMAMIVAAFYLDTTVNIVSEALLLDDPHRGLSSGFSGRFDNWRLGWNLFVNYPLWGVGPSHPDANYTHNGYIKVLAEYGGIFGLVCFVALAKGLWNALRSGNPGVSAGVIALMVFISSSPRYINFQLMPFVGIVCVIAALIGKSAKTATALPAAKPTPLRRQ
jgi:O-antigen ligase